jgi:hypothetical protein
MRQTANASPVERWNSTYANAYIKNDEKFSISTRSPFQPLGDGLVGMAPWHGTTASFLTARWLRYTNFAV